MKFLFLALVFSFSAQAAADWETNPVKMFEIPESDLYGGTKSVAGEFPMMGWIGNCTGTAVGPRTLVTASHCVTTGKRITYTPRFNGKAYSLVCSRHPRYNDRTVYNDYALCTLDSGAEGFPADMPLASFEFRTPDVGEELLLNGYGAPTVTVHHWGFEKVDRVRDQDIETCGAVYLGGGDSGGSLLAKSNDRSGRSGFRILGINSRGGGNCSYFNRISHQEFVNWSKQYEQEKGVKLCGVSAVCTGSQPSPSPSPSQPPVPTNCQQIYEEFAFCIGTKAKPECIGRAEKLVLCVK